jgi:hypothetical protein
MATGSTDIAARTLRSTAGGLLRAYRATGADPLPRWPERAHGVPFEGYFWRIVDARGGTVVVALSAVCVGPEGPWGMSSLATHPGGFARTVVTRTANADRAAFGVRAEAVLRGDDDRVVVDMGPDARLDVTLADHARWPARRLGPLGLAQVVPWLPQYWQPVVLAASVRGRVRAGALVHDLDGATAYVEKNWGGGFPRRWWWGHAGNFGDDVSVSFAGGRVGVAGAQVAPTAIAIRLGRRVIALAPPLDRTRVAVAGDRWRLRTHGRGYRVEIAGEGGGEPHELLVPLPLQQRAEPHSRQHLAGELALTLRRGRRLLYAGRSTLAGLELGDAVNSAPPVPSRP